MEHDDAPSCGWHCKGTTANEKVQAEASPRPATLHWIYAEAAHVQEALQGTEKGSAAKMI
jgi:hypothetical protein